MIGGSGDYFDVADRVVMMENFAPADVTAEAHAIGRRFATPEADVLAAAAAAAPFGSVAQRIVASVCDTPVEKVGWPLNDHGSCGGLSFAKVGGWDKGQIQLTMCATSTLSTASTYFSLS